MPIYSMTSALSFKLSYGSMQNYVTIKKQNIATVIHRNQLETFA